MLTHHWYEKDRLVVIRTSGNLRSLDSPRTIEAIRRETNYREDVNWTVIAMSADQPTVAATITLATELLTLRAATSDRQKWALVIPGAAPQNLLRPFFKAANQRAVVAKVFSSEASALVWAGWNAPDSANDGKGSTLSSPAGNGGSTGTPSAR